MDHIKHIYEILEQQNNAIGRMQGIMKSQLDMLERLNKRVYELEKERGAGDDLH